MAWFSCASSQIESQSTDTLTTEPILNGVEWVLDWDRTGTENHADGSWSVDTDRGYRVTVNTGWIITSAISLVPCTLGEDTGLFSWLGVLWGRSAWAAHAPFSDGSMLELSAKEPLTPATTVVLPNLEFSKTQYCSSYWLLARGGPGTAAEHTSLFLDGTWSKKGQSGTLFIDTDFTRARIADLDPISVTQRSPRAVLTRELSTAFDGIEFTSDNDYSVAWSIISNLTDHAQLRLE